MSSNMVMDLEHQFLQEEEDVFYDELRKQMLHLTEDDDEDEDDFIAARRGSKRSMTKAIKPVGSYYINWWEIHNRNSAPTPTWLVNLWRNENGGTGTGVFIPQIVISSRKFRSGKKNNNGRRKIYKQVGNY